jgi:hypothetical protein
MRLNMTEAESCLQHYSIGQDTELSMASLYPQRFL